MCREQVRVWEVLRRSSVWGVCGVRWTTQERLELRRMQGDVTHFSNVLISKPFRRSIFYRVHLYCSFRLRWRRVVRVCLRMVTATTSAANSCRKSCLGTTSHTLSSSVAVRSSTEWTSRDVTVTRPSTSSSTVADEVRAAHDSRGVLAIRKPSNTSFKSWTQNTFNRP